MNNLNDSHITEPGRRHIRIIKSVNLYPSLLSQVAELERVLQGDETWSEQTLTKTLASEYAFIVVMFADIGKATEDKTLIGYAVLSQVFELAELYRIGTHPDWQRQGVARSLLNKAIAYLKDTQAESLQLEVRADNHSAIALYDNLGFVELYRRRNYYHTARGGSIDGVVMELKLAE